MAVLKRSKLLDKETVKRSESERMDRMWVSVVTLRVIWTVMGQLGYIHPDEFFQSSEIVAGDILNLKVERTWEFDPRSPVRSIVPPYIMCAPAMYIIRWLNPNEGSALWHTVSSQMLLVLPRLMVTMAGIFVDKMVYGMACKLGCSSPRACLMTFATSYVSLVYHTRTLSNTIEAFLFVLLMNTVVSYWSVVSGHRITEHLDRKSSEEIECEEKSENSEATPPVSNSHNQNHAKKDVKSKKKRSAGVDNVSQNNFDENKFKEKLRKYGNASEQLKSVKSLKPSNSTQNIPKEVITMYTAMIALILVVGVFNRPTFPVFAAVPCLVFLLCDRHQHGSFGRWLYICVFKIFKMSAWISVASVIMILCDSFYYGSLSSADFDHLLENISYLQNIAEKVTIAPWNFVKYNSNSDNLAEHGLHPHYLHLLVNTPLLFGILAIFPAITIMRIVRSAIVKTPHGSHPQPGISKSSRSQFLVSAYLLPIFLLSLFPHQEPRFLIPLLCPIALLYGHHLFDIGFKWYLSLFWVIFNIFLCGFFYGALHQGGLIPSVYEVRERILREPFANYHVVFSHTYMPPRHLFQIPNPNSSEESKIFLRDNNKFKHPEVNIHDMKGAPVDEVHQQINWIIQDRKPLETIRIFVVAPSSLDRNFCTEVKSGSVKIEYKLVMSFVPQINTENPPDFVNDVFNCVDPIQSNFCNWTCSNSVFDRLSFALSLNLYSVTTK